MSIVVNSQGTPTESPSLSPTLSLPTAAVISSAAISGTVTTDSDTGTLYWYVSTSETPPTVANNKGGIGSASFGNQAVSTTGIQSVLSMTGLSSSTLYYVHYVHNDSSGDSNQETSAGVTTNVAEAWQLAAGHFIDAITITTIPLEIINPRPDADTGGDLEHNYAYPLRYYEHKVGAKGGSFPYKYELTGNTTLPGASIGEVLVSDGNGALTEPDDYGVVSTSAAPASGAYVVEVLTTDQQGETALADWTVTVDATQYVHLSATGNDTTGDGSESTPYATWEKIYPNHTDSTYAGKIVVFMGSTEFPVFDPNLGGEVLLKSDTKPTGYMAYHNGTSFDVPVITNTGMTADAQQFSTNTNAAGTTFKGLTFDGIRADGANWQTIRGNTVNDGFMTFDKLTFRNITKGTSGGDNPGCIVFFDLGTHREFIHVSRCVAESTMKTTLFKTFSCKSVLFEENIADAIDWDDASNGSEMLNFKGNTSYATSRRNRTVNCSAVTGTVGGMHCLNQNTYTNGCEFNEMCYNTVEVTKLSGSERPFTWNSGTADPTDTQFSYRNTVLCDGEYATQHYPNAGGDDVEIFFNAFASATYPTDPIFNVVNYSDTNDAEANQIFVYADFDSSFRLTGSARTSDLGIRGAEIA